MARISRSASIRAALTALAGRQHGVVSREQMRRLGFSDGRIDDWSREGRLRRVFRGVYAVESTVIAEHGRILAAVLACGPQAVVSHRSAAFLLGIGEHSPRVIDLIVPGRRGRAIDGIRIHDVPYPGASELVRIHGLVCTNVPRTVVDLAGTYGEDGVRETLERAATKRVLDLAAIDVVLAKGPRRRGAPCLRRVLDEWRPVAETARYATVRSLFEAKLLPLVAAARLPMPRVNAPVRTSGEVFEVDLLWPDERFIVEADSRLHHGIEVAFERDRHRDRELLAAHYEVLRVTWREVECEPEQVFGVVRGQLKRLQPKG